MSNKQDKKHPKTLPEETSVASRRKFLAGGLAVAGLAACAGKDGINGLSGGSGANGSNGSNGASGPSGAVGAVGATGPVGNNVPTSWDYTADVVVIGAGAAGLVAALAAQSKGASVLVVEANYDVGGHAIVSGGMVDLGGGTAAQLGNATPIVDSPDAVFKDLVSPAAYVPAGTAGYFPGLKWGQYAGPYQDRAFCRTYADNNVAACKFLSDSGITWSPTIGTNHWGAASAIPRTHTPMWKGATSNPAGADSPGGNGGVGYIRPLEATARTKGIKFLLNYKMNAIHRDQPFTGTVQGVTAAYTGGVIVPPATTPLQPYCTTAGSLVPNTGNIATTQATVTIKANKGVFIATGGASSNVELRKRFDMRMTDVFQVAGEPYSYQTGDGIALSQKVGAALYATANQTSGEDQGSGGSQITKPGSIGCQYGYANLKWAAASPVFGLAKATGIPVAAAGMQSLIHVNMVGQRMVDETAVGYTWIDACMQPNSGSVAPDFSSGPVWAIFDSAAVTRLSLTVTAPAIDPAFFYSGATIAELVSKINTNKYQVTPMTAAALQATITRYNGFVGAVDTDFGKPSPQFSINAGPYYAAFSSPVIHDWLTGIRIDSQAHVIDLDGKIIPGLYAAGEDVGGMVMHGLAKCAVYGMIAGYNAAAGV